MKAFITGGAGFIGSHIAEEYKNCIVYDNLSSGKRSNIPKHAKFVKGDVLDKKKLFKAMKGCDIVYHLAAEVSVPKSFKNPERHFEINTIGFLNVLEAAHANKVKKIVFSSSAAVYGNNSRIPKHEGMRVDPVSPYGFSKAINESMAEMFYKSNGIKTACLRYFNVFGPRQDPSSPYSGVISIFITKALRNEPIVIYGDGQQTRDFVFVKDIVKANTLAMKKGIGVYNIGLSKKVSVLQMAKLIIKITGSKSKITFKKARIGDIKHSMADNSKIRKLGWKPNYSFEQGLKETIEWYKHK